MDERTQNRTTETQTPPTWNQPPQKTPPRRVGTVSMGVALIALGGLLLYSMFVDQFGVMTIAKVAPALLIVIGLELIISTMLAPNQKVKYDFLSVLVCGFLITVSLCASMLPIVYRYSIGREQLEDRLEREITRTLVDRSSAITSVLDCSASVWRTDVYGDDWQEILNADWDYEKIRDEERYDSSIHLALRGDYTDPRDFASEAAMVLDRLEEAFPDYADVTVLWETEHVSYRIDLSAAQARLLTAQELEARIVITR